MADPARPTVDELVIADSPRAWSEAGFSVEADVCRVGAVRIRLSGPAAGRGLLRWSLRGLSAAELDGLPTDISDREPCEPAAHPNGSLSVDHVVVFTDELERTIAALESAGIALRRVRDGAVSNRPVRQAFFRLGEALLEVVEHPDVPSGPASFWGITFVVADLDVTGEVLGERLGEPRDAIQPGRRIATLREGSGIGLPVAFMTPRPPREPVDG